GLFSALFIGVTSIVWIGTPYLQTPRVQPRDVADALDLVAVSLVAFGIGAWIVSRPKRRPKWSFPSASASAGRQALIAAYVLSVVAVGAAVLANAYGYQSTSGSLQFNGIISLASAPGSIVVLVTALTYFGTGRRDLRTPLIAM